MSKIFSLDGSEISYFFHPAFALLQWHAVMRFKSLMQKYEIYKYETSS